MAAFLWVGVALTQWVGFPVASMGEEVFDDNNCSIIFCLLVFEGGGLQYGRRVPMLQTVGRPGRGREQPEAKFLPRMTWGVVLGEIFRR